MTNVLPGINSIEINEEPKFKSSTRVILNQLFETLSSLEIESDANNSLNTLKLEIKVLIKEMLPYSTVTIPGQYYNILTSKLAYFLRELENSSIDPKLISEIDTYMTALKDLGIEYKNQPKGTLRVEGHEMGKTMYVNRGNNLKIAA